VPTYQYSCTECGHFLEIFQNFSDDSLTVCPECEGRLRKVFNAVGVVFKGSGFYRNDSRSQKSGDESGGSSSDAGSGSSDGKPDTKTGTEAGTKTGTQTETKPAAKADSSSGSSGKAAASPAS
jgi:putative FmdB family regulatory protein